MLSLDQLRKPLTRAQMMDWIVERLTALGFETTGWQDGRIQKTILTILAIFGSDFTEVVKAGVEFGFNAYATGDALNEFSKSRFNNQKTPALRTRGPMTLRSTASIPYTIQIGQLIATTDAGVQFRNITGGLLSAGSVATPASLVLTWDALIAGADGNVPLNSVSKLVTTLAGVTVANDTGTPWYTDGGADEMSDAVLQQLNSTKWASMTVELVRESYINIALAGGAQKVAVRDNNPRGPGTIDVYSAGETALLGSAVMAAIQLAFSKRAFQTDSAWVTPWVNTTSRVANRHPNVTPLDVVATLYHDANVPGATMLQRARDALSDYLRRTPIGGWDYSPGPSNVLERDDISAVLKGVEGMRTIVLTTPSTTLPVGTLSLIVEGTWALTTVAVAT